MDNKDQKRVTRQEKTEAQNERRKKTLIRGGIVILTIIIIILLLRSCDVGPIIDGRNPIEVDPDGQDITRKDKDKIIEELNKKVEEGMINISMNTNPVFKNGRAKGNLMIRNNETNRYPQVVEIYRDDTSELIYRSGLVLVGKEIKSATLDVNLPKGEYDCTAYFESIDPDTYDSLGKAGAKIKVYIEE